MCQPNTQHLTKQRSAFTLLETMLTILIVGVGVMAIVSAQQAFHQQNLHAQRLDTAMLLANELREMTLDLPRSDPMNVSQTWGPEDGEITVNHFDDLDDFAGADGRGVTFSPPIDAHRFVVPNMNRWSQVITVQSVDGDDLAGQVQPDGSTPFTRVTCRVMYQSPAENRPHEVTRLTWIVANRQ